MKTGLLLIDIQNDYFEGGRMPLFRALQTSENAKQILGHFRKNFLPVIHIQHISVRQGATHFLPKTNGAEIHENVKPIEGEKIIVKYFPNSFRNTELLHYLQSNQISELVVCGMMTNMCVDSTVRTAKDNGLNCIVISDACTSKELEFAGYFVEAKDVHYAFLAALHDYYAEVISTEQYILKQS